MLLTDLLRDYIPTDHSAQTSLEHYLEKVLKLEKINQYYLVLDLGCGAGESINYFSNINSKIDWYGLDIEKSPEVDSRKIQSTKFKTFDGINIPFDDNYFDLIFCRQVFEHVKNPKELLSEVSRVLKPGGYFLGSTSHLEPFHSYSYWNYTPFGFSILLKEARLNLLQIRPSIDSLSLILRRMIGDSKIFNYFWKYESPLNLMITIFGKIIRSSVLTINSVKLLFCGQFIFLATKNDGANRTFKQ